ncbi:MAG: polymerase I protein [Candidatus Daviesbacteria bacterium GW2011_GWB1_41_5]|uniref:Polymerase I protein n=1 Tax=Candidatus Daviesbacteria bacterium GW2011_GWB1_41_5 TaxID=1618429 RepID=A0A0G0WPR2_9BACT|nr:MAG: polymerase I protein [Candidatus Daviesbacteria bacterium GW2011_GWB1_41_5]
MRLVLIDGNALLHRAYHATPPLTTSKGELVNAVYGFSSMLLKVLQELHPEYLAVAWDTKAPTFRHGQFEKYKATRRAMDESLSSQFERAYEVLRAFNIPEFKLAGFEADDLVGALTVQSAKCKVQNLEVVIMTGDRDIMQLISKNVKVFMSKKTLSDIGLYGEEEFAARFGFAPKNLVDYKGLAGDQSDNIPGVPGIGETTATKLIQKYGDMENIYKHLKELPERLQKLGTLILKK